MGGALGLGSERGELSGCARRSGAYDARSATRLSSVFNTVHGLQLEQVRTHFAMVTRLILALSALFSLGVHASAQVPFDECGVLVPGVTCPNFFQTPNGNMYLLDGYSGYQHGDTVRVQGAFDAGCITFCLQGLGCVSVTSITSCSTTSSVTPYCFGDGSGASCPCGNSSSSGLGCANSSGAGAGLSASGSDSLSADDLALSASGVVANQPALLFSGSTALNGGLGITFGDGLRCAGGVVVRHGVQAANALGAASWPTGLAGAAGWSVGDSRFFQAWYRDPQASPCGGGFNLSNGVSVTFSL